MKQLENSESVEKKLLSKEEFFEDTAWINIFGYFSPALSMFFKEINAYKKANKDIIDKAQDAYNSRQKRREIKLMKRAEVFAQTGIKQNISHETQLDMITKIEQDAFYEFYKELVKNAENIEELNIF